MQLGGAPLLCLAAALMLATASSALPEAVVAALAHAAPWAPHPKPEAIDDRPAKQQEKNLLSRVYKKRVINLPSRGLQITLLPWKCYNQSNCQNKPVCQTSGVTTSCTSKCFACHSCVQPKIIKKRLSSGKISVKRKSYIRTHKCGSCYSHSECSATTPGGGKPNCPKPEPCTLK